MNELPPAALLFVLLFVVLAFSSALTLVGSWLVIWRYRRSVVRAMSASGFGAEEARPSSAATPPSAGMPARGDQPAPARAGLSGGGDGLFRSAVGAPWVAAACSAAAGLAYALVLAFAYVLAFPAARTPVRFALTLWVDLWPVVVAAAFTAPRFASWVLIGTAVYFVPFVLGTIACAVLFLAETAHGWSKNAFTVTTHAYGSVFYGMTAFHAAHVTAGLCMLAFLAAGVRAPGFRGAHGAGAEAISYYWHFVFAVWLLIWATIYFIR